MILMPSHSPEFNPVENLFSLTKKKIKGIYFETKEQTASEIS